MAALSTEKSKLRIFLTGVVKLAVDSTVTRSTKGSSGLKKADRIVQDRLNELPTSHLCSNAKNPEELNFKPGMKLEAEDFHEDVTNVNQQRETSIVNGEGRKLGNELPGEGVKGGSPSETQQKRVFIRSRL